MTTLDTILDRARQWAVRIRSAQVALDLEGGDRERVAIHAGQLLDLAEDIERTVEVTRKKMGDPWEGRDPGQIWDMLCTVPKIAGPWEPGRSGEMDIRRSLDRTIIATTLWVIPTGWGRIATLGRSGADAILREHGWLLAD